MGDVAISFDPPAGDTFAGGEGDFGSDAADAQPIADSGVEPGSGEPAEPEAGAEPQLSGRDSLVVKGKIDPEIRGILQKLKLENPKLGPKLTALYQAAMADAQLRSELPGGFKEVARMRQVITDIGGADGIEGALAEVNGYRDFDAQLMAADPKALETISSTPGGMEALAKLFPLAAQKIAEANPAEYAKIAVDTFENFLKVHPEGYAAYVAQVMAADMGRFEYAKGQFTSVPTLIERLADLIPAENAKATQILGVLSGYVQRVLAISQRNPAAPKAPEPAAADPRAAELDTREQQLQRMEWTGEAQKIHNSVFAEAWRRLVVPSLSKDPVKAKAEVALIRELYGVQHQKELAAKKDFNTNGNRFFSAKQKDNFLKFQESTLKETSPLALRKAMALAGIGRKVAPAAPGGTPAASARPAPAIPGFIRVAQKPNINEVNMRPGATTMKMWQSNQAILKTGKRVTW